jgi:hypothetical protein
MPMATESSVGVNCETLSWLSIDSARTVKSMTKDSIRIVEGEKDKAGDKEF